MAKVKVFVEENIRYWSEIIVDVPAGGHER
ncbi:hypothetical protein MAWWA_64 [Bacillus phage vB_BspH_Mawwa]|nr:hypothetical protein MAWWA_64 [Bacillus phage vB_BspH_Mawwa]QXN70685.1 hypothetical protein TIMEGRIFFIN_66 [Bacillus phage vB_BspH_TimeGriffin]